MAKKAKIGQKFQKFLIHSLSAPIRAGLPRFEEKIQRNKNLQLELRLGQRRSPLGISKLKIFFYPGYRAAFEAKTWAEQKFLHLIFEMHCAIFV